MSYLDKKKQDVFNIICNSLQVPPEKQRTLLCAVLSQMEPNASQEQFESLVSQLASVPKVTYVLQPNNQNLIKCPSCHQTKAIITFPVVRRGDEGVLPVLMCQNCNHKQVAKAATAGSLGQQF